MSSPLAGDGAGAVCGGAGALAAWRFPVVYGRLLGAAWRRCPRLQTSPDAGLVFIDGHEDATPMELSASGEAANMEVALLLGLTGQQAPEPLLSRVGLLRPEALVMLGMRDDPYRRQIGVATIAGRVRLIPATDLHADPAGRPPSRPAGRLPGSRLVAAHRLRRAGPRGIQRLRRCGRGRAARWPVVGRTRRPRPHRLWGPAAFAGGALAFTTLTLIHSTGQPAVT